MANIYYVDSSALVKVYVAEHGTTWLKALIHAPDVQCYIARIAGVEVIAALVRRLPDEQAQIATAAFQADFKKGYLVISMTDALIELAMGMAHKHRLRGYDAVQLAAAKAVAARMPAGLKRMTLIASDSELLAAALKEGFTTDDPNNHP